MKRKGFTLIELLAVIIILGILMLIAIPGVTGYINNSRKNVYVDTAKELVKGTSKILNSGEFDTLEEGVTYYMDSRCISNESGKEAQSPFGKFNPAYVLVVNEKDTYNYYFQSRDDTSVGVKNITGMDSLEISKIVSGVKEEDIDTSVAVGNTTKVALIDDNCHLGETRVASRRVSKEGESMITLEFDNQGGTGCDMQSQYYGEEWGKLCKPKIEGLKFVGWYTKPDKLGDKITKTTKAEKSMKVYAAWTDEYATFDTGRNINLKIKRLSGQDIPSSSYGNSIIKHIVFLDSEEYPNNLQNSIIISSENSSIPIYAWFDTDTIYIWSEDNSPMLSSDASYLFYDIYYIANIDGFEIIDTSNTTNISYMFAGISSLSNIDLSNFDTSNVTDMTSMFYNCSKLTTLDLSNFDTSKVTKMGGLFIGCSSLYDLDISSFDTSNVTTMNSMFRNCSKITTLDLSHFDTSKVTTMSQMFDDCSRVSTFDISSFDTSNVTDMYYMFGNMSITSLNLNHFNTSNVTSIHDMFRGCGSLESLKIDNFDTSNIINMNMMFYGCRNLKELNISHFDTSKVYNMSYMFDSCCQLEILDVSNFDTSKVNDMGKMFNSCNKLQILDVSNFDTSNVTNMPLMFYSCYSLKELNLTSFDTSKVTNMESMFESCSKLLELDLSSFDTSSLQNARHMFYRMIHITTIYASDKFVTSNVTNSTDMFAINPDLTGGNGTVYDASLASNKEYARIDREGTPGFFTEKI